MRADPARPTVVRIRRRAGASVVPYDVYIGREMGQGGWRLPRSKWANPFRVQDLGRAEALRRYEAHVRASPQLLAALPELQGKRLGCWCAPEPCHGNVLVRLCEERAARGGAAIGAPAPAGASDADSAPAAEPRAAPAPMLASAAPMAPPPPAPAMPPSAAPERWGHHQHSGLRAALSLETKDVGGWFDALAREALCACRLWIAGRPFRLREVEMYLHRPGHEDPTVHRAPRQLATCGCWYFHREKAARLGFTLKGVDLTFGRPGLEAGGILIRAIQAEEGGPIVEGPSLVVDAILRGAGVQSVLELYRHPGYDDDAFAAGIVRLSEEPPAPGGVGPIRAGPRVGLRPGPFSDRPYRYRTAAEVAKKDRRGLLAGRVVAPAAPGGAGPDPPPEGLTVADFEALGL